MSNLLEACISIANSPQIELTEFYSGKNRINNMGKALEFYIEDAFAGTIHEKDEQVRLRKIQEVYSYSGNQNNPPDLILRGSDAIEVKKIESSNSALALNSSYPKAKLYSDSAMITQACRDCETWSEKDIIYAIGHISKKKLKSLWMIYGNCYAADRDIYERIKTTISSGILEISDIEFTPTKELGKVKRVDPLGITDLRIRGMWSIFNPKKVFDYVYKSNDDRDFQLVAIMQDEKYTSFPESSKSNLESSNLLDLNDIKIKNPNNPANLMNAKMITFSISASLT